MFMLPVTAVRRISVPANVPSYILFAPQLGLRDCRAIKECRLKLRFAAPARFIAFIYEFLSCLCRFFPVLRLHFLD